MIDLLIITSSVALGIICSIFVSSRVENRDKPSILGDVKYELNNLYFEKSVALEALNKIKQFSDEKKIDEYERDRLSRKYINMLENYNKRVFQLNPILEAHEIYEYKKQLESIISEYSKRIDSKLAKITDHSEFYKNLSTGNAPTSVPPMISPSATKTQKKDKDPISFLSNHLRSSINRVAPMKLKLGKNKDASIESIEIKEKKHNTEDKIQNDLDKDIDSSVGEENMTTFNDGINQNSISMPQVKHNSELLSKTPQADDSDKIGEKSIDAKEIDKIQSDILKTLKRLEES